MSLYEEFKKLRVQRALERLAPGVDFSKNHDNFLAKHDENYSLEDLVKESLEDLNRAEKLFEKLGFSDKTHGRFANHEEMRDRCQEIAEAAADERDLFDRVGLTPAKGWKKSPYDKFLPENYKPVIRKDDKLRPVVDEIIIDGLVKNNAQKCLEQLKQRISDSIEKVKDLTRIPKKQEPVSVGGLGVSAAPKMPELKQIPIAQISTPENKSESTINNFEKSLVQIAKEKAKISEDFQNYYSKDVKVISNALNNTDVNSEHAKVNNNKKSINAELVSDAFVEVTKDPIDATPTVSTAKYSDNIQVMLNSNTAEERKIQDIEEEETQEIQPVRMSRGVVRSGRTGGRSVILSALRSKYSEDSDDDSAKSNDMSLQDFAKKLIPEDDSDGNDEYVNLKRKNNKKFYL